ncbi:type I-B CRISPR-associated protein Cas5b [Salicibibacter kimchii]|uniref:Type I-B CRISPR-associated protein Cas5 n=1 Tax=Salicibibacter kimchii TaxID=2099786 RepID=A0A345C1I6_9BACI|nr:type I-B CRISPR-associated protein Cas5b [Salicibibacter kimchii]AXF57067.1 type I-B CRISPR-associated protein Cas5 [Salicibibacter kimchii]
MSTILVFDLKGAMAQFKKFDTNSSSLTYIAPPRTVIAGLVAGILGYEKDNHYEVFSPENANIAVSVIGWPRKIIQTINYMFAKNKTDLNLSKGRTQIPVEFLFPSLDKHELTYRIFFRHADPNLQYDLKQRLKNQSYAYPPYLGLTEMLGKISWIEEATCEQITADDPIPIHTLSPIEQLKENSVQFNVHSDQLFYQKERMPRFFNGNRYLQETMSYLIERSGRIIAQPKEKYFQVQYQGKTENILFM